MSIKFIKSSHRHEPYICIGNPYAEDSYKHIPSEDNKSGKEYVCDENGVEFFRYDCYVNFSPYGWRPVTEDC